MADKILPSQLLDYSPEYVCLIHSAYPRYIYWVLIGSLVSVLSVLPFAKFNLHVVAAGQARPTAERISVQTGVSGIISELLVKENQTVSAGDVLARLHTDALEKRLSAELVRTTDLDGAIHDLDAILAWVNADPDGAESMKDTGNTRSGPRLETPRYASAFAMFQSESTTHHFALEKLSKALARARQLHDLGILTDSDFEARRFDYDNEKSEWLRVRRGYEKDWQSELHTSAENRRLSGASIEQFRSDIAQCTLTAPISGTIIGLIKLERGAMFREGQRLAEISPADNLVIEALLAPKDLGFISIGLQTLIDVDAFPFTEWGQLHGRVLSISDDYVESNGKLLFRVLVQPDSITLEPRPNKKAVLRKGMSVNVRLATQRLSAWDFLIGTILREYDPAAASD